jgi:hypothetical protein
MSAVENDTRQGWWARGVGESSPAGFPFNASSDGAAVIFMPIRSGAGTLYFLTGANTGAATFIHVFDMVPINAAPASGALPKIVVPVGASQGFSIAYGVIGRAFTRGIVVATSSTQTTYTATAALCSFDAQHA